MKNNLKNKIDKWADEPIVMPDECGDTLWDAVLQQGVNSCGVNAVPKNAVVLLNSITVAQESGTKEAK